MRRRLKFGVWVGVLWVRGGCETVAFVPVSRCTMGLIIKAQNDVGRGWRSQVAMNRNCQLY